jgi:hypothetical protein
MAGESPDNKYFTLTEAERTRVEVEPILIEAMERRRQLAEVDDKLGDVAQQIGLLGGVLVAHARVSEMRDQHNALGAKLQTALERIEATGCVVKDLQAGLLDFPALLNNQEVYLCWRLGEDRIRFYHGIHEGFSGRKPLDPRDTGGSSSIH